MISNFLPDRYPKVELKRNYPGVYDCLQERGILESKNVQVRFVGLVNSRPGECVVFMPHGAPHDHAKDSFAFAKELMSAITKFAQHNSRTGENNKGEPALTFSALLAAIAEDYRDNGIFSERVRIKTVNSGKPDWRSTIRDQIPLVAKNGAPVFTNINTTRPIPSDNNILGSVQAVVIKEISSMHSWWLAGSMGNRQDPSDIEEPRWPREAWPRLLSGLRNNLFAERPLRLVSMLIAYLEYTPSSSAGKLVCGISDFSTVWEAMLRKVLPNVEEGWNTLLPDPRYIGANGTSESRGRMKMDIVVRKDDRLTIMDAKYYKAESAGTAPDWSDIVKQFYYAEALATVHGVPNPDKIENCFIFPVTDGEKGKLERLEMFNRDNKRVMRFSPIQCIYISIKKVISAYCKGTTIG